MPRTHQNGGQGPALRTRIAVRHEVIDGGYLIRAILLVEAVEVATEPAHGSRSDGMDEPVRGLTVLLRPGSEAAFIEARHPYESESTQSALRIAVGALKVGASGEVIIDGVIRRGGSSSHTADVARVMISARVSDGTGVFHLHTIHLPISFSELSGSTVTPRIITQTTGDAA